MKECEQLFYADLVYEFYTKFMKSLLYADQSLREIIREADEFKCVECKKVDTVKRLQVHEIEDLTLTLDSIDKYFSFDNRVSLCMSCHAKARRRFFLNYPKKRAHSKKKSFHNNIALQRSNHQHYQNLYNQRYAELRSIYDQMFEKCKEIYIKNFPEGYEQYIQHKATSNISS